MTRSSFLSALFYLPVSILGFNAVSKKESYRDTKPVYGGFVGKDLMDAYRSSKSVSYGLYKGYYLRAIAIQGKRFIVAHNGLRWAYAAVREEYEGGNMLIWTAMARGRLETVIDGMA